MLGLIVVILMVAFFPIFSLVVGGSMLALFVATWPVWLAACVIGLGIKIYQAVEAGYRQAEREANPPAPKRRFDPYTGEPYRFDPDTGVPIPEPSAPLPPAVIRARVWAKIKDGFGPP